MKRVLVTGASGFIGNYVIKVLLQHNVKIIATSRNILRAGLFDDPKITIKQYDLHAPDGQATDLFSYFEAPDLLIHLAWEGLPNYNENFHLTENLPAHKRFLTHLVQGGLRDITVTGTCFEYGMQEGLLSEGMPAFPQNAYAKAKNALREYLESLKQEVPFDLKWTRLFYMFGEGQNPRSLLSQLDAALRRGDAHFNMSGGAQTRDFMPVEAVAENIVKIALQNATKGIINIATSQPVSVKKFVLDYLASKNKTIQLNLGFYPYPDFEPMHFWGDNRKLKSIQ